MYLPSSDRYIEFLTKRKRGSVCVWCESVFNSEKYKVFVNVKVFVCEREKELVCYFKCLCGCLRDSFSPFVFVSACVPRVRGREREREREREKMNSCVRVKSS